MMYRWVRSRIAPGVPGEPNHGEGGVALVVVMLMVVALFTLAAATVSFAEGSLNLSKQDQDWNASLAAAEAGIDDYIHRINENGNYWIYSASSPPPDGNGAFSGYVPVPGSSSNSKFRYSVDSSKITVDGTLKLTSTGNVGGVKRTVGATLRRRSFIDYLWFTDFETLDPALYVGSSSSFTPAEAQAHCAYYYYGAVGARRDVSGVSDYAGDTNTKNCVDINFVSGDVMNGPAHSNDAYLRCGAPRFNGDTSTSWNTSAPRYRTNTSCSTSPAPIFANAGDPRYLPALPIPPSNSAIKVETAPLTAGGSYGGCLYTGPTSIVLNAAGTMTVTSPFSKQTNNGCVTSGTGPLPVNGVIYVQNVPAGSSDPNYTSGCPYSVRYGGVATNPLRAHPLGYPTANDTASYDCRAGDLFVEGTLKGQLTVAADNDIVVTWHLTYNGGSTGTDLLGLVANNTVQVYHPVNSSGTLLDVRPATGGTQTFANAQIFAALLSVQHSFFVPRWDKGSSLGDLNVTGAIAQRFRGPVGTTGGNGYEKTYTYDQRLKYLSPPRFLNPIASAWAVAVWVEQKTPAGL